MNFVADNHALFELNATGLSFTGKLLVSWLMRRCSDALAIGVIDTCRSHYLPIPCFAVASSGFRVLSLGGNTMNDQMPFGTNDFAMNPEPRCPCVLLLDTSGSMGGQPITELNQGLITYKDELAADALASKRVEVSIVTFGGRVETACDFTTAESFQPPSLSADGDTPMGAAIVQGLQMLQQRKDEYKRNGISYSMPLT